MMFELIAADTWLSLSLTFVFALMVGSFLNVVIHRLPLMMEREWQLMAAEAAETRDPEAQETPAEPSTPFNLAQPASTCPDRKSVV